ncbi:MAG TPA: hypothetical protein VFO60_05675 [Candidatus Dormibacteraeota bacterium]|nr:hypothetical protein [Candidatus Dormibacteraeota bacterium]
MGPPAGSRRRAGAPPPLPLQLPFPVEEPGLPARIALERSIPCSGPFDDPAWRFTVDWAGMRVVLAASEDGTVRVHDERLRDVTSHLTEIAQSARAALRGRRLAVEGVVAVLDSDGCPDLPRLAARLWWSRSSGPALALLVTDLLHLDGASVTGWPFDRRREALRGLVEPVPHIQVPDWVEGEGIALAEAAAARGLPGVTARLGAARYHAGVASADRLRIALFRETDCVVAAAVLAPGGAVRSLRLAEHEGGRLVESGTLVLHEEPPRALARRIDELRAPGCTVGGAAAAEPGLVWLHPELVATVRFHGRSEGRLQLPSLVALREDVDPDSCVRREPVDPPAERGGLPGFRPTVLVTLPFGDAP